MDAMDFEFAFLLHSSTSTDPAATSENRKFWFLVLLLKKACSTDLQTHF
jgi:hypothetical protein